MRAGMKSFFANAKVAKWYQGDFKGRGKISIKNNPNYYIANSSSSEDQQAVQRIWEFTAGWFGGPCTETGDYPDSMRRMLGSFLPDFTSGELAMIKRSSDFYVVDSYSSYVVPASPTGTDACAANSK